MSASPACRASFLAIAVILAACAGSGGQAKELQPEDVPVLTRVEQLQTASWLKNVPPEFKPFVLRGETLSPVPTSRISSFRFHWAIISCGTRPRWGRMITTTLLSGILHGLHAASINIVYCKPYDPANVPSFLYNLRHSHYINIWFPSNATFSEFAMREDNVKFGAYWGPAMTGLLIPTMLQQDLPVLFTEDDVIFAPNANARIQEAVRQVLPQTSNGLEPFALYIYQPNVMIGYEIPEGSTDLPQNVSDVATTVRREIPWGFQGVIFSQTMIPIMANEFADLITGRDPKAITFPDTVVYWWLQRNWCNNPAAQTLCHSFVAEPNIVQHTGTTSATYQEGKINRSFHLAKDFPMHVRFAGFENDTMWRRRRHSRRALLRGD